MTDPTTQSKDEQSGSRIGRLRASMLGTPEMCIERGYLLTRSYQETESHPSIIRRARALEKIVTEISILIEEDQLLAGVATSKKRGGPIIPEIYWDWYLKERESISTREWDRFQPLTDAEKEKMEMFLPYWQGRSLYDKWRPTIPGHSEQYFFKTFLPATPISNMHQAHTCPEYERVLKLGYKGLLREVESRLERMDPSKPENIEKMLFYRAAGITLKASMAFIKRYAALAEKMAGEERSPERRAELKRMAGTCEWISEHPARNFYDALQLIWLTYIVIINENWGPGQSFGRLDQILIDYYQNDIDAGALTRNDAKSLLAMFFVKLNGLTTPFCDDYVRGQPGFAMLSCITIGGIDASGKSAVNDLSFLFLEAEEAVGLTCEEIVVRVHKNTPEAFLMRACKVARNLRGKIKFVGDEAIIPQLLKDGKPADYARDYVIAGCFIPVIPGRSHDYAGDFLNLAAVVELALNNGYSRITGEKLGPQTGDPGMFTSFDDVWEALKKQIAFQIHEMIPIRISYANIFAAYCQYPFTSCFYESCVEKGVDWSNGGTAPHNTFVIWIAGTADAGDSLAGLKKTVFDDGKITMTQLIAALDDNFEAHEDVQHLLSAAPKFGNDIDYVDDIVNDIIKFTNGEASKYTSCEGAVSNIAAGTTTTFLPFGYMVGALPNGRKKSEPLADGGISPAQGRNISGPTSTMRSALKVDGLNMTGGSVLNMRFNRSALKNGDKMHKFAALLRTYFENGGHLVQFNVTDSATFRAAQKNPGRYRDLLVRVATYSAYFVDLPKELQDDIIARTEFRDI